MRGLPLLVLALAIAPAALAESPEPDHAAIVRAVRSCTAEGAFGHRFGEKNGKSVPDGGAAPFAVETLSGTAREDAVFEITAAASFARAKMSGEDRVALADWVLRALDAEAAAEHRFTGRTARRDGVLYVSGADFTLDLSRDGTDVRLTCTSIALKQRAREQMREPAN